MARSVSPERASATPRLKCASGRRWSRLTARKRAVDCLLIVAEAPINGREPEIGAGVILIERDALFRRRLGRFPTAGGARRCRRSARRCRAARGFNASAASKRLKRAAEIAAREFDPRPEQLVDAVSRSSPSEMARSNALGLRADSRPGNNRRPAGEEPIFPRPPPNDFFEQGRRACSASPFHSSVRETLYFASISADSAAFSLSAPGSSM